MVFKVIGNNKGQVLPIAAIAVVVMIGVSAVVIDLGHRAVIKSKLQAAVDQAALAGAASTNNSDIVESTIESVAQSYAQQSPGKSSDTVTADATVNGSGVLVKVTTSRTIPAFFASGGSVTVTATAKAVAVPANSLPAGIAAPFVMEAPTNMTWDGSHTQQYTMKINPTGANEFGYANICFKNNATDSEYLSYLKSGDPNVLTIDDTLYYWSDATGGQLGVNAFMTRLTSDTNTNYDSLTVGEARLMMVPVVSSLPSGLAKYYSGDKLKIQGFVGFFLQSVDTGTAVVKDGVTYYPNLQVKGRFVKVSLPPTTSASTASSYYGPVNIYLVDDDWTWS
ncbi:MAG: putative Flp pilus-assembly TadE/G-like [Firmicutes bacterium]|nr:putative Flp pilus-assembly TadE/G-like [Bacillota bacterium]